MVSRYAFRGVGPRVFISYRFADATLAGQVAMWAAECGCWVQMEDEASLVGRALEPALERRVADAEAFVQVRTPEAARSYWVQRELKLASAAVPGAPAPVIVLLVLDEAAVPDSDAARAQCLFATAKLDDNVRHQLCERLETAVHGLPFDDADPLRFQPEALARALRAWPVDRKRFVVDSPGTLHRWMDRIIANIEQSTVPHREKWLEQELQHQSVLIEKLRSVDGEVAELVQQLADAYDAAGLEFPGRAGDALDYFALLRIGVEALTLAQQVSMSDVEFHRRYAVALDALGRRLPDDPKSVMKPYLTWRKKQQFPIDVTEEERVCSRALARVGIDDRRFWHFVPTARRLLESWSQRPEPAQSAGAYLGPAVMDQAPPIVAPATHGVHRAGPETLLSFGAVDAAALRLTDALRVAGCRVNPPATDEALANTEVFVQLRANDPGSDPNLDAMFEDAVAAQESNPELVIIPVLVGGSAPVGRFNEWVYIDAREGLSEPLVDLIVRSALAAVHALPVDRARVFELDEAALMRVVMEAPKDGRRIVVDSDDVIAGSARRIIDALQAEGAGPLQAALDQQRRFLESCVRRVRAADVVLRKLVAELHAQHQGYSVANVDYADRASLSIQRFARLVLAPLVQQLGYWSTRLPEHYREAIGTAADRVRTELHTGGVTPSSDVMAQWALRRSSPSRYANLSYVRASTSGRMPMTWLVPGDALGSIGMLSLTFGARPDTELTQGDWMDIVLPQIAARAVDSVDHDADLEEQLEERFGWRIEDYDRMYPD